MKIKILDEKMRVDPAKFWAAWKDHERSRATALAGAVLGGIVQAVTEDPGDATEEVR